MLLIYSIPFISGIIGWVTNYIAIKMLFHPKQPRNLYLFKLHGIFPKRRVVLAERLSVIVANQLLSKQRIKEQITDPNVTEKFKASLIKDIQHEIENYISSNKLLAMFASKTIMDNIVKQCEKIIDKKMPSINSQIEQKIDNVDIQKIVNERILDFSNEKFEDLIMGIIKKELKFIELAGAVLGFTIGLIQVLVIQIGLWQ